MKYSNERRDWVRMVDDQLPAMEAKAAELQRHAADLFADWSTQGVYWKMRYRFLPDMIADLYSQAQSTLMRCIYYKAMREANRD